MASLRFAVVVAVLAGVAAAAPSTNTTESTKTSLEEKRRLADEACKNIWDVDTKEDNCHQHCLLKSFGAVDDAGRYMEGEAADWFATNLPKEARDEAAIKQAAKTCNFVNDNIAEGCNRARQIADCMETEFDKIINRDSRAAKAAAANKTCTDEHDACHKFCVLNSFRVVDQEGYIDTRAAVDLLALTYPDLSLYKLEDLVDNCGGGKARLARHSVLSLQAQPRPHKMFPNVSTIVRELSDCRDVMKKDMRRKPANRHEPD